MKEEKENVEEVGKKSPLDLKRTWVFTYSF